MVCAELSAAGPRPERLLSRNRRGLVQLLQSWRNSLPAGPRVGSSPAAPASLPWATRRKPFGFVQRTLLSATKMKQPLNTREREGSEIGRHAGWARAGPALLFPGCCTHHRILDADFRPSCPESKSMIGVKLTVVRLNQVARDCKFFLGFICREELEGEVWPQRCAEDAKT